jgi:phage-related protein
MPYGNFTIDFLWLWYIYHKRDKARGAARRKASDAKPLTGFGGAGVLEVVENSEGATYRAVYTVRFAGMVYVLHVFKKKSVKGKKTPKPDINLIKSRLKDAERDYAERYPKRKTA